MNTGQIIKSKSTEKFTVISNDLIKSKELTLAEKGLLTYLLSLPSDWVIYKQNLYNSLLDKAGSIDKYFKALQKKGYILSVRIHNLENGKFLGWNHVVYDVSTENKIHRDGCLPTSVFTDIGESTPILKTNVLQKTNIKQNTNRIQTPPQLNEVIDFFIEKGSNEEKAKQAYEYYQLADWHDSKGNRVKNWKQKMLAIWINNNNFSKTTNHAKSTTDQYKEHSANNLKWANEWDAAEGRKPFSYGKEE